MTINNVFLQGELTLSNAEQTKAQILAMLENPDSTNIDMSEVTEIDAAGLQLLLVLLVEAKKMDKTITFSSIGPAVNELLDTLNIKH